MVPCHAICYGVSLLALKRKQRCLPFVHFLDPNMCQFRFALFASLWSVSSALRTAPQKSWDDALAEAEITLAKECGNECLAVLHAVVNASSVANADNNTNYEIMQWEPFNCHENLF